MSLPGNGIFVVQGEMAMLVTAMRRSTRWGSHSFPNEEYDVLMRTFQDLKSILNQVDDLRVMDPSTYLSPFLEVIRSKETTGAVTSLALSAINKFLAYGLIDPTHASVPATVEDIADAVTHARFVGTDHASDSVVLMKILQVLRTLMLSPEGSMLTDESVCEIMLSCFRICFETRLSELLRRNAEQCLRDMTQLIFMRLPQFAPEDATAGTDFHSSVGLSLRKKDKASKKRNAGQSQDSNTTDKKSSVADKTSGNSGEAESKDGTISKSNTNIDLNSKQDINLLHEAEITIEPAEPSVRTPTKKHGRHSSMDLSSNTSITQLLEKCVNHSESDNDENEKAFDAPDAEVNEPKEILDNQESSAVDKNHESDEVQVTDVDLPSEEPEIVDGPTNSKELVSEETGERLEEYINPRGIRFTPQDEVVNLQPYGLVCVRELFRFLISLCNPLDTQNTSAMVHLGLCLVGTALEVGADQLAKYPSFLYLVKDPLCRNLLSLLNTERISIFALDLQISFLLFESLRFHLKYQMEAYFKKLIEIISADTTKAIYELKEISHLALESLAQMFRIPGMCTELYLNYDCDIYCSNLFEDLTKLLSKNVVSSSARNIHSLSLDALMIIIEAIEVASTSYEEPVPVEVELEQPVENTNYGRGGHVSLELGGLDDMSVVSDHVTHDISQYYPGVRVGRQKLSSEVPSEAELDNIRNMKKWIATGTELFNQKPERGIESLQEHGVLATPLEPTQVAAFLRENPLLDKKMIGEYICKRSARGEDGGPSVLAAFADSFDYAGLRIDQALRMYLETFRLPGEAPLIFLVMEHFAERWHACNGEPFANTDAAFRLAYAVIMLNMDQHNHNAKKLNVPMVETDFVRNLRGCNGSGDFDQTMLEAVFNSIKNEEMVMPAEHTGPVRDAYLWRVLQRRGTASGGRYLAAAPYLLHARLFTVVCPPAVTALSSAFERAPAPSAESPDNDAVRALLGLERCAALIARAPLDSPPPLTIDTLVLTLCKFTGLLAPPENNNYITCGVALGGSPKAQLALRRACAVVARHADCVHDAWRHLLEMVRTLYVGRLLPKSLMEAEDYLAPGGVVPLVREPNARGEAGLLSSLYSYIALGDAGQRAPTPHERALTESAVACVAACNLPPLLLQETKFVRLESLQELVRAMASAGTPPEPDSVQLNPQLEDIVIFFMELLAKTTVQNRDRALHLWEDAGAHLRGVLLWSVTRAHDSVAPARALSALLRTAARLMRSEHCASRVLDELRTLFRLPYKLFYQQAERISCGLYELVKSSAQNVHSAEDWDLLFSLLAAAGAGAWPRDARATPNTASSRSEESEDESERRPTSVSSDSELSQSPHAQGWIVVRRQDGTEEAEESVWLRAHRVAALARCCEALALVVRDVAHVTPYNFRAAVRTVRIFVRATLHKGKKPGERGSSEKRKSSRQNSKRRNRNYEESSEEEDGTLDQYHLVSMQLLDLMHTLHSRTAQIFRWWREEADQVQGEGEYDLWEVAWLPLLQGIAQFCTDGRKQVANSGVAYLQRALLAPGLQAMGGAGWESCFQHVLFPLLERLPRTPLTARADTVMCKVFLHHLSALSSRPMFSALWLRVVAAQRTLVEPAPPDDALREAALESLKNMILVMDSVKVFSSGEGYNELWYRTWENISEFLPNLKEELFPNIKDNTNTAVVPPAALPSLVPVNSPALGSVLAAPALVSVPGPALVSPAPGPPPAAGSVPIRNPLYAQPGLSSSVLLQPLNQMVSTPIGIAVPSQMPILYPNTSAEPPTLYQHINLLEQSRQAPGMSLVSHDHKDKSQMPRPGTVLGYSPVKANVSEIITVTTGNVQEQSELYSEYLSNPYNDAKELSPKEPTLYDPDTKQNTEQLSLEQTDLLANNSHFLALEKKALSTNSSPMRNANIRVAQFSSTDNLNGKTEEASGIFNFSSYFGATSNVPPGSEILFGDTFPTQEG